MEGRFGDRVRSHVRALFRHPLSAILLGAFPAILTVRRYFLLPFVPYWIIGGLVLAGIGVYLFSRGRGTTVGLIMVGAGAFGLYTMLHVIPSTMVRRQLVNRSVHLVGQFQGDGQFRARRINGTTLRSRFYLPRYALEESASRPAETSRLNLAMTATVRWPYDSEGFANWLTRNGYVGYLEVHRVHDRRRAPPGSRSVLRDGIKQWLGSTASRWSLSSSFLSALVLGNKQAIDARDRTIFQRLGLVHLFVISGFHVGLVVGLLCWGLKRLGPWSLLVGGLTGIMVYLWFLGWPPSATRAGLMFGVGLLAHHLGRRTSPVSWLLTAVVVMMVIDPLVAVSVGFQLTVSAVLGIFLLMDYARWLDDYPGLDYVLVSAGAFFGIMPVLLYHFHYLPAHGILFSTAGVFLFPALVVLLGIQSVMMAVDWTFFADRIEYVLQMGMEALGWLARGSHYLSVTDVSLGLVLVLAVGLVLCLDWRRRLFGRVVGFLAVMGVLTAVVGSGVRPHTEVRLIHDEPVVVSTSQAGHHTVVIPRFVRLGAADVKALGRRLKDRGIRHVNLVISDYTRAVFNQLDPSFTVGQFRAYWRRRESIKKSSVHYNFRNHELSLPGLRMILDHPDALPLSGYQPSVWVGWSRDRYCLLNRLNRMSDAVYQQIQGRRCQTVHLREESLLVDDRGRRRSPEEVRTGADEWFVRRSLSLWNQVTQ